MARKLDVESGANAELALSAGTQVLDAMIARAEASCRRSEQALSLAYRGQGATVTARSIQTQERKQRIMEETLAMLRGQRQAL